MTSYFSAMHKIIYIAKTHHSVVEAKVKGIDMHRSTHIMMSYISKCQSPPSQKEIAQTLKISPAAVAATLERLEENGYIEKTAPSDDRRVNRVKTTEKGERALLETADILDSTDTETFSGLSEDDVARLIFYLDTVAKNLTDMKVRLAEEGGSGEKMG